MASPGDPRASYAGPPPPPEALSKVELSVSCAGLTDMDYFSKSDPVVFLYERQGRDWLKLGRTEVIDNNLNPKFSKTFVLDYRFEEVQTMKFAVYDVDNFSQVDDTSKQELIGSIECTLSEIVTAGQKYTRTLRIRGGGAARGTITIQAEEVQESKFLVHMDLSATKLDKKDWFGKSDPFVEIAKAQEGGVFTLVYRSEHILRNLNPKWPRFEIPAQKLCSGDFDRALRFSVWDWNMSGSHEFIGSCTTTLRDICPERGGQVYTLDLTNPQLQKKKGKKYTNSGKINFNSVKVTPIHTFVDYILGGCQINLICAVDFTASNGKPHLPSSLHYNNSQQDNEYIQAIRSVASVLAPYDSDQLIPVYGFGANLPPDQTCPTWHISHCFPLNGCPDRPEVFGVEGILEAYRYTLGRVQLYGPTNFATFLDKAIRYATGAVTQQSQNYYILMVITDGVICDMQQTVDRIVAASSLPLSIVIVGVGGADFTNMEILDADDTPLVSSRRVKMSRDIVQFVPFRHFRNRSGAEFSLARETLAEIPGQLTSFMRVNRIKPNPPVLRRHDSTMSHSRPAPALAPAGPPPYSQQQAPPYMYPTNSAPYPQPGYAPQQYPPTMAPPYGYPMAQPSTATAPPYPF